MIAYQIIDNLSKHEAKRTPYILDRHFQEHVSGCQLIPFFAESGISVSIAFKFSEGRSIRTSVIKKFIQEQIKDFPEVIKFKDERWGAYFDKLISILDAMWGGGEDEAPITEFFQQKGMRYERPVNIVALPIKIATDNGSRGSIEFLGGVCYTYHWLNEINSPTNFPTKVMRPEDCARIWAEAFEKKDTVLHTKPLLSKFA